MLGVYIASPVSTSALLKLAVDVFMGNWRASPLVSEEEVDQVTLRFPKRRRSDHAVIDGELVKLEQSVTLKVHPGGLKVLLPAISKMGRDEAGTKIAAPRSND